MSGAVLDSSAVLALLLNEPGGAFVLASIAGAAISTLNYCEVVTKMIDLGIEADRAAARVAAFALDVVPFDEAQARRAAILRATTKRAGLSLGDRACVALAMARDAPVMTADKVWASLSLEVPVIVIR